MGIILMFVEIKIKLRGLKWLQKVNHLIINGVEVKKILDGVPDHT